MRFRLTIRRDAPHRVELRGYADMTDVELSLFALAMKPYGIVIASPAPSNYQPFTKAQPWDVETTGEVVG